MKKNINLQNLNILKNHTDIINSLTFNNDGTLIASAS